MNLFERLRRMLWRPGVYHLPRLLSFAVLIASLLSLGLALLLDSGPALLEMPAVMAMAFLLLAFSVRLARWELVNPQSARRARLSRILAGLAAMLTLTCQDAPFFLAAGLSMLCAVLILQAHGRLLFTRQILLTVTLIVSTWLVIANLYGAGAAVSSQLRAAPVPALLLLALTLSISLAETRNGLIPLSFAVSLGERGSVRMLLAALLIPLLMGYVRMEAGFVLGWSPELMESVHVFGSLGVMLLLLMASMSEARQRIEAQQRMREELETDRRALEALLDQGAEFYLSINLAGRILDANEGARRYLGLGDPRRSVVCLEDVLADESRHQVRQLPDALLRGISENAVLLFQMADGETMPLYVTAACRNRSAGQVEIALIGRSMPLGLRVEDTSRTLLAS
jgi:PAS domain-containing protein